jgi:hypothetical protein
MTGLAPPPSCTWSGCTSGLPTRPYQGGRYCARCSPAARAGLPEPDEQLVVANERLAMVAAAQVAEVAA